MSRFNWLKPHALCIVHCAICILGTWKPSRLVILMLLGEGSNQVKFILPNIQRAQGKSNAGALFMQIKGMNIDARGAGPP